MIKVDFKRIKFEGDVFTFPDEVEFASLREAVDCALYHDNICCLGAGQHFLSHEIFKQLNLLEHFEIKETYFDENCKKMGIIEYIAVERRAK